jgi:transposase
MASIQRVRVRGYSYWRIVESRRVNGKPRVFVIAHLGKADDLLVRLQAAEHLRLRSRSHGATTAVYALARELDVAGTIDRHLAASGRRDRRQPAHVADPRMTPQRHDGLTVGRSLELVSVGRTCHATSKQGFAEWARTTTLGDVACVDLERLSSQHFWDQMDQVPIEVLAAIEREIVASAIERFSLPLDTILYDATNFFTFIASTNARCKLPARGHNKQKRHDLRQLGVALLCTRRDGIPLMHQMYGGKVPDARSFAEVLPLIRQRLVDLGRDLDSLTLVYDKGNVSQLNQGLVDQTKLHYVASLTASSQRALITQANPLVQSVKLDEDESVMAYRTRRTIWGAERTLVIVVSETLRAGQIRGILQHVASAKKWLQDLADTLRRGKQKRDRATLQRDIQTRLMGRQHLSEVLQFNLSGTGRTLRLTWEFDQDALDALARDWLGRLVLVTDRDDWSTAQIIRAYRGQTHVEAVFAHMKDPMHVMLRPQYHWTDQKLHVHVFTCVLSYLLARLLHLRAQQALGYTRSMERLLDTLAQVRRVNIVRSTQKRGVRVTSQLEDVDPDVAKLIEALKIQA